MLGWKTSTDGQRWKCERAAKKYWPECGIRSRTHLYTNITSLKLQNTYHSPVRFWCLCSKIFHITGKTFIKPRVIPPFQSDKVAEPLKKNTNKNTQLLRSHVMLIRVHGSGTLFCILYIHFQRSRTSKRDIVGNNNILIII